MNNQSTDERSGERQGSQGQESSLRETAQELGQNMKGLVSDAASSTTQGATSKLDAGKARAAEGIGSLATAIRKTGENLRADDDDTLTSYIDTVAGKLDSASRFLQDRSLSELANEAKSFAQREPAMFLGGALVVGLIGGRFLKSSATHASAPSSPGGSLTDGGGTANRPSGVDAGPR